MRSLLNFLIRFSNVIIFLLLEGIALYLLSNGTSYHNIRLTNAVKSSEGLVKEKLSNASVYFSLREINNTLMAENLELRNQLQRAYRNDELSFFPVYDSIYRQEYIYTSAGVVNNSVNRQNNFITINKGLDQGVREGMAVVSSKGVAGVVVGSGRNYAVAMSLLNLNFRLSARFRKNGYFGSLVWDGLDPRFALLNEIPRHVEINIGDTIETSGFSAIFPEGVFIGTVSDFKIVGGDFYSIKVALSTEFSSLRYVYVIGNLNRGEQIGLEDTVENRFIRNAQ